MITVALSKGRLLKDFQRFLKEGNLPQYEAALVDPGRNLYTEVGDVRFIFAKGADVPVYVENGIADLGIVGEDIIREQSFDVMKLAKLPFGKCRLSICGLPNLAKGDIRSAATSFVNLAEEHFLKERMDVEVVHLHGSVELAPLLGLTDAIVDIVQTGTTLKANGLVEYEEILPIQARLIANKQSFYTKEAAMYDFIQELGVL